MNSLDELLEKLWQDYDQVNKQAHKIHELLEARGETVVNDHIAFRTFNHPKVGVDAIAKAFEGFGYAQQGEYEFKVKKLLAKHYEHPSGKYPRVFISELRVEEFSKELQDHVTYLLDQVDEDVTEKNDFPVCGVPWKPIAFETYEQLKKESEYAAWLACFGFRANHFTVLVNSLKGFESLEAFNTFLKDNGFKLNDSGGEIKGTPQEYLEQSSTMADPIEVTFSDQKKTIPGCYYEFAKRYGLPDGTLFSGFIAKSADKIFESTDNK